MAIALRTAATGLQASSQAIKDDANNLANLNTNGYKRFKSSFYDLAYRTERRLGEDDKEIGLIQMGNGVAISGMSSDFSPGEIIHTEGNGFNVAISGVGFFVITKPDGSIAYTRNGEFMKDSEGKIVMVGTGYQVGQQAIVIPDMGATDFTIKEDGTVSVMIDNAVQEIGRVEMANFINPNGLKRLGQHLFEESEGSGAPMFAYPDENNMGTVKQYYIEKSNVDPILSILSLTESSHWNNYSLKAFEVGAKIEDRLMDTRV
ncbi:MAG: flagellar hook-basal body complex protein [Candidatus Midichloria sp.]|nr:flagellar hook-basal body complex protein [Candidatus Midichloria sp.]